MSTLKTNNVQVGQSVTATNNFTIYQPSTPDGTVRIGVGNSGATTSDAVTINSSGIVSGTLVSGTAVASTSGTSINFTGIPSTAKRITVMFSGVSTNGTSDYLIQIGSGSVTTSGYLGGCYNSGGANYTTGFGIRVGTASAVNQGAISILLLGSNIYVASGVVSRSDTAVAASTGGQVTLSGTLDRVRITTVNGTDTFDAGTINIMWEG